jgi:peptide/histidine transporter 3/4
MPLIVNGDGSLAASYKDRDLVHEFYTRSPEPTETTPLNPHVQKQDAIKLRRRIRMRRFCITCLVLAELCERFAYYGIVINLVLFLDNFGWSMFAVAGGVLVYSGIAWFMCALGGLVADSRYGRHSTIVAGFIVYFIGAILLVCISIWVDYRQRQLGPHDNLPILPWLAVVLLSIAAGEGAVKANLSTFSAEQLKGEPPNGTSKNLFNCFYWVANVFALFGLTGVTYIQQTRLKWSSGFTLGFAIPVISLTLAAASFLASSKYFVVDGPHGTGLRNVRLIFKQAWEKRNDNVEIRYNYYIKELVIN